MGLPKAGDRGVDRQSQTPCCAPRLSTPIQVIRLRMRKGAALHRSKATRLAMVPTSTISSCAARPTPPANSDGVVLVAITKLMATGTISTTADATSSARPVAPPFPEGITLVALPTPDARSRTNRWWSWGSPQVFAGDRAERQAHSQKRLVPFG